MKCPKCGSEENRTISFTSKDKGQKTIIVILYCKNCSETLNRVVQKIQEN